MEHVKAISEISCALRELLHRHGAHAQLAFALVGAELAAKQEGSANNKLSDGSAERKE
jgi:hypothetical protein